MQLESCPFLKNMLFFSFWTPCLIIMHQSLFTWGCIYSLVVFLGILNALAVTFGFLLQSAHYSASTKFHPSTPASLWSSPKTKHSDTCSMSCCLPAGKPYLVLFDICYHFKIFKLIKHNTILLIVRSSSFIRNK